MEIGVDSTGWFLCTDDEMRASRHHPHFHMSDGAAAPLSLKASERLDDGVRAVFEGEKWRLTELVKRVSENLFSVKQNWTRLGSGAVRGRLIFEMKNHVPADFTLIPAVSYDGNGFGSGKEPKGLRHNGEPWFFSGDRTALPGATFSEGREFALGVFCDEKTALESGGVSCGLYDDGDFLIHRIGKPCSEGPMVYSGRDAYEPARDVSDEFAEGASVCCRMFLYGGGAERRRFGWTGAFDAAWPLFRRDVKAPFSTEKVWELGIHYAKSLIHPENGLPQIGLLPDGAAGWAPRRFFVYEAGWCGQNASLAAALLHDARVFGNEESRRQGERILDFWTSGRNRRTGLIPVSYNKRPGEFKLRSKADTCNLGWAAWWFLNGYREAREMGLHKPLWFEAAAGICRFFLKNYSDDYFFGSAWNVRTGRVLGKGGSAGAFLMIPLLELYRETGEEAYLNLAERSFRDYRRRDLDLMRCGGGALDTGCIDKESGWPLLRAALDLYEMTGRHEYLEAAEQAGFFILSWMMHMDVPGDEDFRNAGYSTFGGTAVSTQHHHLDPWGALIAGDWLRLGRLLEDPRWIERAGATWANAVMGLSDGTLEIHGRRRPKGSQNEAYFHTNWTFDEAEGRMNDWLVVWPTAFRLITLMQPGARDAFDLPAGA